ncbi:MAG: ornithine--oxo-acid transaminase [Betaproteobacteria bacterium]|nr:ornithine--oxo-acid transaminase [Betaproteobacteria bacterium]
MNDPRMSPQHLAKTVQIVGVACGHGARNRGCEAGADVLYAANLVERLQSRGHAVFWCDTIRPDPTADANLDVVAQVCEQLAQRVEAIVARGDFPLILGGDHSCAVGTWKGVAAARRTKGPIGLIWIDAHMDAHTPQTSPTGALHGMPLACLLGRGEEALVAIGKGVRVEPRHVCLIGVRSYERGEADLLAHLGVQTFFMEEVQRRGLEAVIRDALDVVQDGTAGFGVTIDLDVLDPGEVPGVGSPAPGGIAVAALRSGLIQLARHPALLAAEIAEYNPRRDRHAATGGIVADLVEALLAGRLPAAPSMPDIEHRYGAHHYDPLPVVLVRGEGVHLWDEHGRRYIDMMSAYSAVSHGHCHPRLVRALTEQARMLAVTSRAFHNQHLPLFLKRLCEVTGQDLALPANTGLEAVEAALKAARKWGHKVKCIPEDKAEIIACEDNFHGRSIAILAMSSEHQYRDGFGPFPPGFKRIPYGDAAALARAITPHTAAFLVEPIQGEGGIIVPPPSYLSRCAEICRQHNVLLICDEVQTGLGRTGRMFACEHEGVKPDGIILGKALGGGLLAVSAFVARREVMEVFGPGDHGSTFGGNPLAAAVGLEALNVLVEERLPQRAAEFGAYLLAQLRMIESPLIRDVRGKGLLIGVEIDTSWVSARVVCEQLLENGVLTKDTHDTVLRFAPPLVITREQIDQAVTGIRAAFVQLDAIARHAA